MYIHTYTYIHICVYVYIYIERERDPACRWAPPLVFSRRSAAQTVICPLLVVL